MNKSLVSCLGRIVVGVALFAAGVFVGVTGSMPDSLTHDASIVDEVWKDAVRHGVATVEDRRSWGGGIHYQWIELPR